MASLALQQNHNHTASFVNCFLLTLELLQSGVQQSWMASGARNKFGAPMFEPEVFRKQMYCIEKRTCDIVGTFRRSPQSFGATRSDLAPGKLCLTCLTRYSPDCNQDVRCCHNQWRIFRVFSEHLEMKKKFLKTQI